MPQTVSASAPLPGPWGFLIKARPFDPVADVPESRAHTERHQLIPRRPVRKQLHQIGMQPHRAGTPALRLPNQHRRRIPRIVEIAPFQLENLGDPQAGSPHDERRGSCLVPVVGRQRVEKPLDLVGRPVVRNIHDGRVH